MTAQAADPGPVYKLQEIHPEVAPLHTAALAADWGAVRGYFAGLTRADDMYTLVSYVADFDEVRPLHEFAGECAAAAPPGSRNGALVALAHIEHWLDLPSAERGAYLAQPAVAQQGGRRPGRCCTPTSARSSAGSGHTAPSPCCSA